VGGGGGDTLCGQMLLYRERPMLRWWSNQIPDCKRQMVAKTVSAHGLDVISATGHDFGKVHKLSDSTPYF